MGIPRSVVLNEYYYDEFLAMMEEYNELHRLNDDEVLTADDF